jgi:thiamine biosynthesis lipoprotein
LLGVAELADRALGVSAPHGRLAAAANRYVGHVMDPRTGEPVVGAALAAVACPSATDADALSTALLVLGADYADELRAEGYTVWLAS